MTIDDSQSPTPSPVEAKSVVNDVGAQDFDHMITVDGAGAMPDMKNIEDDLSARAEKQQQTEAQTELSKDEVELSVERVAV